MLFLCGNLIKLSFVPSTFVEVWRRKEFFCQVSITLTNVSSQRRYYSPFNIELDGGNYLPEKLIPGQEKLV